MLARVAAAVVLGAALLGSSSAQADSPFKWTGLYAGVNLGVGSPRDNVDLTGDGGAADFVLAAALQSPAGSFSQSITSGNLTGGGQLGYNWQFAKQFVVGLELDLQVGPKTDASDTGFNVLNFTLTSEQDLKWFGTMRGRVGFLAAERFMVFGTGGLAFGRTEVSSTATPEVSVGIASATNLTCILPAPCLTGSDSKTSFGVTYGGGVEVAVTNNLMLKFEYMRIQLGDQTVLMTPPAPSSGNGFATAKFDNTYDIIRAGLNYKF